MSQAGEVTGSDVQQAGDEARRLRAELTGLLLAQSHITSPAVEEAFRTVPREAFVPAGTPLEVTYSLDNRVVTKTDTNGQNLSSVSATYIQARMLEMAELAPGMTVLEIGSGGYNAALLAEVVGPGGRVVSVDIDADITDRASELLDRTGYGSRVTVMQADAGLPVPGFGSFDRILVTAGAWDIAPAWLNQLTLGGVLVVPLRFPVKSAC